MHFKLPLCARHQICEILSNSLDPTAQAYGRQQQKYERGNNKDNVREEYRNTLTKT